MTVDDRKVRILLVGDAKTGKTSLILSLVGEEFPDIVPARSEEITIPAEVTPEKVPTFIVDYSSREQTLGTLKEEIRKADVICIVYDVTSPDTVERLSTHWLPFITQQTDGKKPIVLAGNKDDLQDASSLEQVMSIMEQHKEVETCVECSAKELKNVSEMFYYAQKAVLYPTAPLYSPVEDSLRPKCVSALKRIFWICDGNADGYLSDDDLKHFQCHCFDTQLESNALDSIKNVIQGDCPSGITGDGISLEGFLFLHKVFVQRGRHETTWTVLRAFGYDDNLDLRPSYIQPPFNVSTELGVELTLQSTKFLVKLFELYDKDADGALSPAEEDMLCGMSSAGVPWRDETSLALQRNCHGYITLSGFLSYWLLMAVIDLQTFFKFLGENGYAFQTDSDSVISAVKTVEPAYMSSRQVFHCAIHGQSDETTVKFLHHLNKQRADDPPAMLKYGVMSGRKDSNATSKHLILYKADAAPQWVDINLIVTESCDLQALQFVRDTMNGITLEKVCVAWLSEGDPDVTQINAESVRRLDLPPIQPINLSSEGPLLLCYNLIEAACNPQSENSNFGGVVLKMMISFAVGLVAVFITQKFFKQ